jgi:hypothetical protein
MLLQARICSRVILIIARDGCYFQLNQNYLIVYDAFEGNNRLVALSHET